MKKLWIKTLVAIVLCLCFLTEQVYAADLLKYKETKYNPPLKDIQGGTWLELDIDATGKLQFLMNGCRSNANSISRNCSATYVTYDSEGRPTIKELQKESNYDAFDCLEKDDYIYYYRYRSGKKDKLYLYDSNGNTVGKWSGNIKKELGIDSDELVIRDKRIADVDDTYNVILFYSATDLNEKWHSYAICVNIQTGEVKKLFSFSFPVADYDGEYVYGYKKNEKKGTITFYQKSVETKKTNKFTTKALKSVKIGKYYSYNPAYAFYDGKVMGIAPKGGVYYGTFSKGKFKKIGSISTCKNFKKYTILDFAMKSKNEFYLSYSSSFKKGKYVEEWEINKPFVVKYAAKQK